MEEVWGGDGTAFQRSKTSKSSAQQNIRSTVGSTSGGGGRTLKGAAQKPRHCVSVDPLEKQQVCQHQQSWTNRLPRAHINAE